MLAVHWAKTINGKKDPKARAPVPMSAPILAKGRSRLGNYGVPLVWVIGDCLREFAPTTEHVIVVPLQAGGFFPALPCARQQLAGDGRRGGCGVPRDHPLNDKARG